MQNKTKFINAKRMEWIIDGQKLHNDYLDVSKVLSKKQERHLRTSF